MILINQKCEIITTTNLPLQLIEAAGRTCYKSESKINDGSAIAFVRKLNERGHHSVIEHSAATVRFITNRGVTHELVRHRIASFSQESTRYVDYKRRGEMEFIRPVWYNDATEREKQTFIEACSDAEEAYTALRLLGWSPEKAREVLPNALKTEIVMTANLREWQHVFKLRCSPKAHPQMRSLMLDCKRQFKEKIPVLFE